MRRRSVGRLAVVGALALAGVLLPVAATPAAAQSCSSGGDSGGSSSSGGGDGDGGGSWSSSSGDAPEICRDHTSITGLTECRRFGDGWDASSWPTLDFGVRLQMDGLSLSDRSYGGVAMHDENPYGWTMAGEDVDVGGLFGLRLRGTGFLTPSVYTGVEVGFGIGSASGPRLRIGELEVEPSSVAMLEAGVVGGFAVPLGPLVLRAEVLTGVRAVGFGVTTQRGDCIATATEWHAGLAVAPRVGVDLFVLPWLSIGGYGGTHLLGTGDWHGGIDLRVHTRSFDGQRRP